MRKISFVNLFLVGLTLSAIASGLWLADGVITAFAIEQMKILLGEANALEAVRYVNLLKLSGLGAVICFLGEKGFFSIQSKSNAPNDRPSYSAEAEEG